MRQQGPLGSGVALNKKTEGVRPFVVRVCDSRELKPVGHNQNRRTIPYFDWLDQYKV